MSLFFAQSLMPAITWGPIAPEIIVCLAAVVVMLIDAFARPSQRWISGTVSLLGLGAAGAAIVWLWSSANGPTEAFNGMIVVDELRLGFTLVFLLVSFLTLFLSTVWVGSES